MPVMAPQSQQSPPPTNPNMVPPNIGSSEPDTGPNQPPASAGSPNMAPDAQQQSPDGNQTQNGDTSAIQARLDALPDNDKKFLAQYLTPEFNYALGLVAGPDVAQYLNQFTDQNKVLVPVSRQEAARIQQAVQQDQQQKQGGQGQPQGQPQPAQGQPQAAPQQAQGAPSMAPQAPAPQAPAQQLPNGVTPAPMQGGVMAPRA